LKEAECGGGEVVNRNAEQSVSAEICQKVARERA